MKNLTKTLLHAAVQLDQSAAGLDRVVDDMKAHQNKHETLMKRMLDLVKSLEPDLAPKDRAALNSLSARLSVHRRGLDKEMAGLVRARENYGRDRRRFAELSDLYASRLATQTETEQARQTREAGLARVLSEMVYSPLKKPSEDEGGDGSYSTPKGSHGYISVDLTLYMNMLIETDRLLTADPDYAIEGKRYRPVRFLEIGSGSGRNTLIARDSRILMTDSVAGFDLDPNMIARGHEIGLADALFVGDALEQDYGGYDVIYSYRPFSNLAFQEKLEARMVATMDKGAYVLAPLPYDIDMYPEMFRASDNFAIWKKVQ